MLCDGSLGGAPTSWERPLEVLDVKLSELNSLINDLLTAARAEANVISAEPIALDLREAVSAAIDRALPGAEHATGRLIAELPAEPSVVDADPEHVARILDNLINNAMTYSKGPPIVRVTVTADPPRVTVFDNGVGIASELRERIFERFFRITEGDLDPRPGTGLGLYISRSLAERQGANLRLEWSRPGRGSAFVLAFPQASLRSEESDGAAPSPLRAATPDSDATEAARTA